MSIKKLSNDKKKEAIRQAFKGIIRSDFEHVIDDIPLLEMGIDSLDFFEQIVYLEEDLGLSFKVEDVDNKVTINDLVKMLKEDIE